MIPLKMTGRFLVAIGWAEAGILGTIEGVDGDEEAFSYSM